jgi:biopolymer transport protein ExbD
LELNGTDVVSSNLQVTEFLGNDGSTQQGIRKILHDRNKGVLADVEKKKQEWRDKKITEEQFQEAARQIRNSDEYSRPVVIIKPLPGASWESVISALDEMQINQISRYQLGTLTDVDEAMVGDYKIKHAKR